MNIGIIIKNWEMVIDMVNLPEKVLLILEYRISASNTI